MARWIFTIYLVLCLSCALNRDSSETNQKLFPAWVPFKFGISYDGSKLPNFVIDGDESMLKGKYEQAYIQYVSYTVPSNLREDVYHRLAVSLILMKQPIRAYELTQRLKARQYFNNSNGALIRIKALLDAGFFEKAFFEAEKLLNNKPSMTISSKLRIMIMEKIQLVSPAKSLISNEARFPRLNELIDGFQSKVDQSRVEKTASTIEAQQRTVCALLPLSGSLSEMGSKIAMGLRVAFDSYESDTLNVRLFIKDVGSHSNSFEDNFVSMRHEVECSVYVGPFVSDQVSVFERLVPKNSFTVVLSRKLPSTDLDFVQIALSNRSQIISILKYAETQALQSLIVVKTTSSVFSDDFSKDLVTLAHRKGVEAKILELEGFDAGSIEAFEKSLDRLKPQAIVVPFNHSELADFLIGLSDKAKSSYQFIGTALLDDKVALSQTRALFAEIVYPSFLNLDEQNSSVSRFVRTMKSKSLDNSIDIFSALGFEVGDLLLQTFSLKADLTNSDFIATVSNRTGILGTYSLEFLPALERYLPMIKVSPPHNEDSVERVL